MSENDIPSRVDFQNMTSEQFGNWMAKEYHKGHLSDLMNRKQCESFTTSEFTEELRRYYREKHPDFHGLSDFITDETSRISLESFGIAREVEPNLWAMLY